MRSLSSSRTKKRCLNCFNFYVSFSVLSKKHWIIVMHYSNWYHLYNFKKCEKHACKSVTFGNKPATLLKVKLFHGWFLCFLNCTNETKSHRALNNLPSHLCSSSTSKSQRRRQPIFPVSAKYFPDGHHPLLLPRFSKVSGELFSSASSGQISLQTGSLILLFFLFKLTKL